MAVTVYTDMTLLDAAESTAGWTIHNRSGAAGTLLAIAAADEEVTPRQGTYCLGYDLDIENGGYYFGFTSRDYSSSVVYIWAFALNATGLDSKAAGGIYIIGTDGTNFGYWYVGGYDNYSGGWKCWAADLSRTPNANNGANPNMSACTGLGIGFNNTVKSKAAHNMFFDYLRVTSQKKGISVTTSAGSVAKWSDIYNADNTNAIGLVRREGGVYLVQGPISFGSGLTLDCEFYDTGQLIVFDDADVPSGHYLLSMETGPTTTSKFQLGDKSGSRGISGCVFKTAGSGVKPYNIDFRSSYVDEMLIYGSTFLGADNIYFPKGSGAGNPGFTEVISTNFEQCGQVYPSSTTMQYDFFINSYEFDDPNNRALNMIPQHDVTYTTFISCKNAINIAQSGYYTFNNLSFIGSLAGSYYDVENSAGPGTLFISATDSNPSVVNYGSPSGTITIINTVPLSIKVIDANGDPIENAQTAIYYGSIELMNEDTLATGFATQDYNYAGLINVEVRVRKGSSTDSPKYLPIASPQQITDTGLSTIITLYEDTNNNS